MWSLCARPFGVEVKRCIPIQRRCLQRRLRGSFSYCVRPTTSSRILNAGRFTTLRFCSGSHLRLLSLGQAMGLHSQMDGGESANVAPCREGSGGRCCCCFSPLGFVCCWALVEPGPAVWSCRCSRVGWWPSKLQISPSHLAVMSSLPPGQTPLNRHSLRSIEEWLTDLGAICTDGDPCLWRWHQADWSAEIRLDQEDLLVTWQHSNDTCQRSFPYGLSRLDVEAAMRAGP